MISILTLFAFFLIIYCFGETLYFSPRQPKESTYENFIYKIATGLGALPLIGVLLSLFKIPLDWKIFLGLAIIVPILKIIKYFSNNLGRSAKFTSPDPEEIIVLLIFLISFLMYLSGAFGYPWLENDDPWANAGGIKYISIQKNLFPVPGFFHYLNPYPPGYPLLLGILHQIHPSLSWVMKFFNALIVAMGFPFFYYFSKEFTRNKTTALWATILLAIIPCYLNHFIWAHALVVTLFFPAFYSLLKAHQNPRYILSGGLIVSGILLTQPTQAIKFFIMAVILISSHSIINKKFKWNLIFILLIGAGLSLTWWGGQINQHRNLPIRSGTEISGHTVSVGKDILKNLFDPQSGTATRAYTWTDYVYPPEPNLINNPYGIGVVILLLALFGIFLTLKLSLTTSNNWQKVKGLTVSGWLVFTFLGLNSMTFHLPVGLFAFRFWMLFAIPICLLAAEFLTYLSDQRTQIHHRKFVLTLISVGIFVTSGLPKMKISTSIWPWGIYWTSEEEIKGYLWLKDNLPVNTRVFSFTDNIFVIGLDMRADYWSEPYQNSFSNAIDLNGPELHQRLTQQNFEYVIIGGRDIKKFGENIIEKKVAELESNRDFQKVYQIKNKIIVFKIK